MAKIEKPNPVAVWRIDAINMMHTNSTISTFSPPFSTTLLKTVNFLLYLTQIGTFNGQFEDFIAQLHLNNYITR